MGDVPTDVLRELRELRTRVSQLEGQVATQSQSEERSTRRGMLRLAGAAVVGGAAALGGAQPAAATSGAMQYGLDQDAGTDDTGLTSSNLIATLSVHNTNAIDNHTDFPEGVRGTATGSGTGVRGSIDASGHDNSWGVWGDNGATGYALVGTGGTAQLWLKPYETSALPNNPRFAGEFVVNEEGAFVCVANGEPGVWRKIAGPSSAGTFHAITPTRVYDSRAAAPIPGLLATGSNRLVSVANGRNSAGAVTAANIVPAGATAVTANVTVTGTTGGFGYLAINPGGNTVEGASTINWSAAGQTLANGVNLTLNATREITVICNGGGSTHFIVDISGYYL